MGARVSYVCPCQYCQACIYSFKTVLLINNSWLKSSVSLYFISFYFAFFLNCIFLCMCVCVFERLYVTYLNIKIRIIMKLVLKKKMKNIKKLPIPVDTHLLIYLYLTNNLFHHTILLYLALIRPTFCTLEIGLSQIKVKREKNNTDNYKQPRSILGHCSKS